MCELMDNLVLEGRAEGRKEGKELGRREMLIENVKLMYRNGMSISNISIALDLAENTVKKILSSKSSNSANSSNTDKMNYFEKEWPTKDKNKMK